MVSEGHAWFLRRFDPMRALQFLAAVEELRPLRVLPTGPKDVVAATEMLRRFHDQTLTLTDSLGLYVMAERQIRSCWSTNFHLALTGAELVIHTH